MTEPDWMVGNSTFDKETTRVGEQMPEVEESGSMLLEFVEQRDMVLINVSLPNGTSFLQRKMKTNST